MTEQQNEELFKDLIAKANLKQDVYQNTLAVFNMFKEGVKNTIDSLREKSVNGKHEIPFEFKKRGDFEIEMKFAGDILIFMMHTNVFEIPRDHFVMRSSYVKEDPTRSYCGIINIYNFLADSFKYNRINDSGYLIGRVFINKDMHYFIEGKKEIGMIYNNFVTSEMNHVSACTIVESAIRYTMNFDLLTPPYENVKEVNVFEFISKMDAMSLKTGKRLGFQFQADKEEVNNMRKFKEL
ncbi:MAG: hypothetical protein CVU00_12800 [Bacteroidetes bacterium HGW-Bacteroidetes-17]|jgi:hypothetical protein|nr:MAG: hypothetical protein CVU00_12800 [Bacteroidetes bacterium HGW-Bacteroidetes-17]